MESREGARGSRRMRVGLDATVYKSETRMRREFPGLALEHDPTTGEWWAEDAAGLKVCTEALDLRVGNIAMIGLLRELVGEEFGEGAAFIQTRVLYSGSHSGDVIKLSELEELEREAVLLVRQSRSAEVRAFADKMIQLIEAARQEGNPIVF